MNKNLLQSRIWQFLIFTLLFVSCTGMEQVRRVSLEANLTPLDGSERSFDLDAGEFSSTGSGDIVFGQGIGSIVSFGLLPTNGSMQLYVGFEPPSPEECQDRLADYSPANSPLIDEGSFFCVLSNENRVFIVRIEELEFGNQDVMVISYATGSY